jgi:hypothetical protein
MRCSAHTIITVPAKTLAYGVPPARRLSDYTATCVRVFSVRRDSWAHFTKDGWTKSQACWRR